MAEGQHQKNIFLFAQVPPSKLLGKAKRADYCSPLVAQIEAFNKRMQQKAVSLCDCDERLTPGCTSFSGVNGAIQKQAA